MDIRDVYLVMKNPEGQDKDFKAKANEIIKRPIPKELIKQREGAGKMQLSYIEGETVISLLNEAFGAEGWSFQIVDKNIIHSEPKQMSAYNQATKRYEKLTNPDGSPRMEAQPPIYEVHGRLIVPGFGTREQFGTKVLIGGSSEQEGAAKAAATDALKKCATLFGIGLELYADKPGQQEQPKETSPYTPKARPAPVQHDYEENPWGGKESEIRKLKELKAILGVDDNDKLNPYVAKFTGSKGDTYEKITPANISAFNKFLEKEASKA